MTLQKKALAVIEGLCIYWADKTMTVEEYSEVLDKIYRYSHVPLPSECKHPDWLDELEKDYKELSAQGMCYAEREGK